MGSELIALLEKEAAAEQERILGQARTQAQEIRATAQAEGLGVVEAQRAQEEARLRSARVRVQGTANLQAQALLLEQKDRALAEVFHRAADVLAGLVRDRDRYGRVLRRLVEEGAREFSGRMIIEAPPDDLELVRAVVRDQDLDAEVRAAGAVRGGVRLTSPDGRYIVFNTLAFRLERARPALVSEVARILWG